MVLLAGGDIVGPHAVMASQTLLIENGRIAKIIPDVLGRDRAARAGAVVHNVEGHLVVPGFIDVHVHGVAGVDMLDEGEAVAQIAAALPRFGVTAFCPTTMACEPGSLRWVLEQVQRARAHPAPMAARVLPVHIESNFINPRFRGAQPLACLRTCGGLLENAKTQERRNATGEGPRTTIATSAPEADAFERFEAFDILREIDRARADVAIVTLAPEIDGGLDLVRWLKERGIRTSLGHSGATLGEAEAAIAAGASQATHLFNCMPPLHHRDPGLAGAVLRSADIVAELVCDGVHVHPAILRVAIAAKTPAGVMAVTDGTAAAALGDRASAHLGGRTIVVRAGAARLDDGTLAGSVLTMDGAFRMLTGAAGCSPVEAAQMCSTTPARVLGLAGHGVIEEGGVADLVVLDRAGEVVQTYIDGRLVYARGPGTSNNSLSPPV